MDKIKLMVFKIHYSKLTHHFFYLQNMSLWRPFCHRDYNEAWLKITGNLTQEENRAIENFKMMMQKQYKEIFDSIFNKSRVLNNKDIQKVFRITEKKFKKIWDNIKKHLPRAKDDLNKLINNNLRSIEKIIKKLKIFYRTEKNCKTIKIYMILLPKNCKSGGGKFILKNNIILEGNIRRFNRMRTLEILLHEIIHLYFEDYLKNVLYPKFSKEIEYHPLKEIIASSLLPTGSMSNFFLNTPLSPSAKKFKLTQLAKEYLQSNKSIDSHFVKQCIKFYKKQGPTL